VDLCGFIGSGADGGVKIFAWGDGSATKGVVVCGEGNWNSSN
jgi:hypothetical protein